MDELKPSKHSGALDTTTAVVLGVGLAAVLFGNLMVPSYAAGDIAAHGTRTWEIVALAGVANIGIAVAGAVLAITGRQPHRLWVAGALAIAAAGLLVPIGVPVASASFVPLSALGLLGYALAAGFAQLSQQTAAVARAPENQRSEAVGAILRWHLVAGIILGGIPFFFSWQAGELGLAVGFAALAVAVALRRESAELDGRSRQSGDDRSLEHQHPDPNRHGDRDLFESRARQRYGPRRLWRETGSGSAVVATGQVAWVVMYLIPGLLAMSAAAIAAYAVVAQLVAAVLVRRLVKMADRHQRRAATISGTTLLVSILGVAILPATITGTAGIWIGGAWFVAGEVSANVFIAAVEGLISLEVGAQRAQLAGHALKFAAVGVAAVLVSVLAGILDAHLAAPLGAIATGVIVVAVLAALLTVTLLALRARQTRSAHALAIASVTRAGRGGALGTTGAPDQPIVPTPRRLADAYAELCALRDELNQVTAGLGTALALRLEPGGANPAEIACRLDDLRELEGRIGGVFERVRDGSVAGRELLEQAGRTIIAWAESMAGIDGGEFLAGAGHTLRFDGDGLQVALELADDVADLPTSTLAFAVGLAKHHLREALPDTTTNVKFEERNK